MTVHFEFRQFMRVAKSAIKEIFHDPTDVFWTGRAMDLLFHGIQIDCDVNKAMAQVVCDEIRDRKDPRFRLLDNGKMMFSMFGGVRFFSYQMHFCFVFCTFLFLCSKILHQMVAGRLNVVLKIYMKPVMPLK